MSGPVSGPELVTAEDLVDLFADEDRRDAALRDLAVAPGFAHYISETAREVGRLRRFAEPDSSLAYLADRIASRLEGLWLGEAATAGDYYRAGLDIEDALEIVDRHVDDLRARMGGR